MVDYWLRTWWFRVKKRHHTHYCIKSDCDETIRALRMQQKPVCTVATKRFTPLSPWRAAGGGARFWDWGIKTRKIPTTRSEQSGFVVRLIGLEPTRRETLDPKSSASTNFATGANLRCKGSYFLGAGQIFRRLFIWLLRARVYIKRCKWGKKSISYIMPKAKKTLDKPVFMLEFKRCAPHHL